jgi:hypothetical protein
MARSVGPRQGIMRAGHYQLTRVVEVQRNYGLWAVAGAASEADDQQCGSATVGQLT